MGDKRIRRVIDACAGDEREDSRDDKHGGRHFHGDRKHTRKERQNNRRQRRGKKQPQRFGKQIGCPRHRAAERTGEVTPTRRMKENGEGKHAQKGGENRRNHSKSPPSALMMSVPPQTPSAMQTAVSTALMQ